LKGDKLPQFNWSADKGGALHVTCKDQPAEAKLWQATNEEARDFRLMTIGPAWRSTGLKAEGRNEYVAKVEKPAKGWTGYFVELTFTNSTAQPFKFTTDVHVIPDVLPYKYVKPTPPK
jgi:PhoPQ-activated pathogenicity-related protein